MLADTTMKKARRHFGSGISMTQFLVFFQKDRLDRLKKMEIKKKGNAGSRGGDGIVSPIK